MDTRSLLSRQPMPLLRREPGDENKSAKGGYVLQDAEGGERKLTILSTGSELISRSNIGLEGRFVGMHSFGASGKIADVYKKFDINAAAVVRARA